MHYRLLLKTVNIFLRFLYPNLIEIAVMFLTAGFFMPFFLKIFFSKKNAELLYPALFFEMRNFQSVVSYAAIESFDHFLKILGLFAELLHFLVSSVTHLHVILRQ